MAYDDSRDTLVPAHSSRYEVLGLLGEGAMGQVYRVVDQQLQRVVAMKVLRPELAAQEDCLERFSFEARCAARLQHPGLVPVHDAGRLDDGRHYFTMQEIKGETLDRLARHRSLHQLVDILRRCGEAVQYAHEQGVLHRDLKPENIMVGEHGTVLVLDWGIAGSGAQPTGSAKRTQAGMVAGTPAYMAPEQAGGLAEADARADVYGLGSMLYEFLTGQAPYRGSARAALSALRRGPPTPVEELAPSAPPELLDLTRRAMARDPESRLPCAADFAAGLAAWLEGRRRHERAAAYVTEAMAQLDRSEEMRGKAGESRRRGHAALAQTRPWHDQSRKLKGWTLQDDAARLEAAALRAELEGERCLEFALRIDPSLEQAHVELCRRHLALHRVAEAAHDDTAATRHLARLQSSAEALSATHGVRIRVEAYLHGLGTLRVRCDHPAQVTVFPLQPRARRMQAGEPIRLGPAPAEVDLPRGSYLCVLHRGSRQVNVPVLLARQQVWEAPVEWQDVDEGEVLVPAGSFLAGGDPDDAEPARPVFCHGFVMRRYPVTNAEYLAFLNELVASGREREAVEHAPAYKSSAQERTTIVYGRRPSGEFVLQRDAEGDVWLPDHPVVMVTWFDAMAFATWEAQRTGQPWRLPAELEWEKAARGVDGRLFPMGDHLDPSWVNMRDSHALRPLPAVVDSYPVDSSVYGVRGLGGNVRDWCLDRFEPEGPKVVDGRVVALVGRIDTDVSVRRANRGGAWAGQELYSRVTHRMGSEPWTHDPTLGFRLVRTLTAS
jgi:eukaryotic-like serine/threonine-protein kinase